MSLRRPEEFGDIIEILASEKSLHIIGISKKKKKYCKFDKNVAMYIRNYIQKVIKTDCYMVAMHTSHLSSHSILPWLWGKCQMHMINREGRAITPFQGQLEMDRWYFSRDISEEASQNIWLSVLKSVPCLILNFAEEPETIELEWSPRLPWQFIGKGIL